MLNKFFRRALFNTSVDKLVISKKIINRRTKQYSPVVLNNDKRWIENPNKYTIIK